MKPYFDYLKSERERLNNARIESEKNLEKYKAEDDADMLESKDWSPAIAVLNDGRYIQYGTVEVPARYIESISVSHVGAPPRITYSIGNQYALPASPTAISIKTIAGNQYVINVSRHRADALLEALLNTWRELRSL